MPRSARETVEQLIRAGAEQDFATTIQLLSEHSFSRVDSGRIYIGHRGVSDWIRDFARDYKELDFIPASIEELERGFVLVHGTERRTTVRGDLEAVPGVWLFHVADGLVTSCMYFRTEVEAIRAISGPGRDEAATHLIDRAVDAFNRRDFVEMVGLMRPDLRFSSVVEPGFIDAGVGAFARHLATLDEKYDSVLIEFHQLNEIGAGFVVVDAVVRVDSADEVERRDAVWLARVQNTQIAEFILHESADAAHEEAFSRNGGDDPLVDPSRN